MTNCMGGTYLSPGESEMSLTEKNRIKICILAPSLEFLGGQSRQAVRLLAAFQDESSLHVDFIPHDPRLPRPLLWLQRIKYIRTVITTLLYWTILAARLHRYDLIHIFSASYYSYLFSVAPAIMIGKLYGKKVILNYRSGEAEDHLKNWPRTTVPVMKMADVIVAPSGYLVDVFARYGLYAKTISNIVELERFKFRERVPVCPAFLCSRSLEPLYNIGCALRAFQLIQERYPQATLTIAADGSQRPELEQLTRDLQLRGVAFIGAVPFERMPELYDGSDIYLNTNDIDNMPASILECFASGLLVVTTDAGGIPYILRHEETGLMVSCGDYKGAAESALRLLSDPPLASRLAHSARSSVRRCTPEAVRDAWLRIYEDLAIPGGLHAAERVVKSSK
jgi:glycosyltransferase involved in cell wall biosynthesis